MEENDNLEKVEKIIEDSPLNNPDVNFCENTTYLELLLANAKDEDEAKQIKETINGYLDITDETPQSNEDSSEEEEEDENEDEDEEKEEEE